jgi:lipopolysaccharide/colanic/teichoic acid biosynthesis glycosyltransferase
MLLNRRQRLVKRSLDVAVSIVALVVAAPVILVAAAVAARETGASGLFRQERVGLRGRRFQLVKIRTMWPSPRNRSTVTAAGDPRITPWGRVFRRTKIDELPQFWNVLRGEMSLVGPRPDVPELMDSLAGDDRVILEVRPGITGPATLKYRREEELLAGQPEPDRFNREVLFRDKVRINRRYVEGYRLHDDLVCLWLTLVPPRGSAPAEPPPPAFRRAA